MKPISFSFGTGSRNEASNSLDRPTKTKTEESDKLTLRTRKGKSETKTREKLKTKEPNAHLKKPDFSKGTKSLDAYSALKKGDIRGKSTIDKPSPTTVEDSESTAPSIDLAPDAATLGIGMGSQTLGELAIKLDLNSTSAKPAKSIGAKETELTDLPCLSESNSIAGQDEVMSFGLNPVANSDSANMDSTELKTKLNASTLSATPGSKTTFAMSQAMSADIFDPKLLQDFAQANSSDLANPDRLQSFVQSGDVVFVDPKSVKGIPLANNGGAIDPSGKITKSPSLAADVNTQASDIFYPAADIYYPASDIYVPAKVNENTAADIYYPAADIYYPPSDIFDGSIDIRSPIKLALSSTAEQLDPKLVPQAGSDSLTLSGFGGTSTEATIRDPKFVQNSGQWPSQDLDGTLAAAGQDTFDSMLIPKLSTSAPSDLMTTSSALEPQVKAPPLDQTLATPLNSIDSNVKATKDNISIAVSQSADLWTQEADVLEPVSKKNDADTSAPHLAVDASIGSKPAVAATPKAVPALDRVQVGNILKQVSDRLEALAAVKPRNGVTIHLKPFDLGQITMTIKGSGKSIEAEIQVSNESVKQALEQTQKHLSASLEARGYSLANITISESASTNAQTTHSDAQSQLAQQQGQSQNASSTPRFDSSNGAVETAKRRGFATSADGVDYWI